MQFKNDRTRDQCAVHLKIRVLCGRSDQDQRTILHKGEQIILLALIKPVDLVNKQYGLLSIHPAQVLGLRHYLFHILLAGNGGIDLRKLRAGRVGDHPGQSRLPRTGRPIENDRTQFVCLDRTVKQLILPYDMLLSHYLIQCSRP